MYISRVTLNEKDTYAQHQALWGLFPNLPERKRDYLFRIEEEQGNQCVALLQSASKPVSCVGARVVQSKSFTAQLKNGDYFRFKLVANPTRKDSRSRKIIELDNEGEQISWLQRKLTGANITVTSMSSRLVKSQKCFTARFVTFEGVLQVTDSEKIYRALVMGIGRKKHAGAGLLSLASS